MTNVPCVNFRRYFEGYELNITARKLDGESTEVYAALIVRTVKLWLYLASQINAAKHELPDEIAFKSAELSVEADMDGLEFDGFDESRVTVFDWNHKLEMTLHSHSLPQPTLDLFWAMNSAKADLNDLYPITDKIIQDTPPQPTNEPPATPKGTTRANQPQTPTTPQGGVIMSKKDAIAKLQPGDNFKMKVVQIKKRSQDGKDYYELYEPYGGKPGDFAAVSVFADNEVALNNGFIANLDALGIKLGQALTGNWVFNCAVGKPKEKVVKGEKKVFTNIYANSFES